MHHRLLSAMLLTFIGSLVFALRGEENAALRSRGSRIEVTCAIAKPLNDRWHKAGEMLNEQRPAGPIINDLTSARITVRLPVPLTVTRIGILTADYKDSFAMAKDVTVEIPGQEPVAAVLTQETKAPQFFPCSGKADQVTIRVRSVYPPRDTKTDQKRVYGSINQVQVLVSEDLDALFAIPTTYAQEQPTYVMRTPNLDPQTTVKVIGTPRKATEHPCTIWDAQDIAEIKGQIKTLPKAKRAYEGIVAFCEKAVRDQMVVPDEPDRGDNPKVAAQHNAVAVGIGNLGIGYALSGNEAYAKEAKRLLLELAKRYESWPVHQHPKFVHDSAKWSWQRLNEAIWIIPAAWGYDLIYNSPSMSAEERQTIADKFIMPCARDIMRSASIIRAATNWSAICAAGVMTAARVCGDQDLYEKSYMGLSRNLEEKQGGIFYHLDQGIDDDGMWAEGAIGYQFMAMRGLLVMAEILWHDGIDVYGYRNGRLKLVFDSPLWFCYPGGSSSPAVHDSGSSSLFGRDAHLYQYARRRYGDTTYNAILRHVAPSLESVYNLFLPAFDFATVDAADLPAVPSTLFPGVGFAIARTGAGEESKYLFMDYGPNRSHGHPDKLNFNLFALGQELFADAGSAWYSLDIYKRYYSHTLAHNTVTANGMNQIMTGGRLEAYGSLGDMAVIRASSDSAIPACALDRTLVMFGSRLYDIYMVKSGMPYTLDLPYHCHGELTQSVATAPWADHPADKPGYAYFTDPLAAKTDGDWACSWTVPKGRVDLRVLGETGTQAVFATTPKGGSKLGTTMIRRRANETVFGSVMDTISTGTDSSIKSVRKMADRPGGYALVADLASGGQEVVMANFSGGLRTFGEWTTDARVAAVQLRGNHATGFYMAGGTRITGPGVSIHSETPTLLACRVVKDGLVQLANQGEGTTQITLTGMRASRVAYTMDRAGKRLAGRPLAKGARSTRLTADAYTTYELISGKQPTVAEHEAGIRRAKIEAMVREEQRQRAELTEAAALQAKKARAAAVPADFRMLVQAEDMVAQAGGKVNISTSKVGSVGEAFSGWNNPDHWLEYTVEAPRGGYYQFALKYCREGGPTVRSVQIDGEFPHPSFRKLSMPGTGGWSNGTDNWQFFTLQWPLLGKPFLIHLTKGPHRVRLNNVSGGGLNLDYLLIAAPAMAISWDTVE
jgi:hypothetical protein